MQARHILFQDEVEDICIGELLNRTLALPVAVS
jgi:hypothetical protein